MSDSKGNSNTITREYLDSLLIETRYMDAAVPDTTFHLYGRTFPTPVMTAALSHMDRFIAPGSSAAYAKGAADAGVVTWIGMEPDEVIGEIASYGAGVVEIIKPYADRDLIYKKIRYAEKAGLLAVGIDIDHAFGADGSCDVVDGNPMMPLRTEELAGICRSTGLPVIVKGVLSAHDADRALLAGAGGLVLSHHNNRIAFAVPPLLALGEIRKLVNGAVPIFVEDEIVTGIDAFKALALGADAVCIGRPLMSALRKSGAGAVTEYLNNVTAELKKAMACTGCTSLDRMDPSVIRREG